MLTSGAKLATDRHAVSLDVLVNCKIIGIYLLVLGGLKLITPSCPDFLFGIIAIFELYQNDNSGFDRCEQQTLHQFLHSNHLSDLDQVMAGKGVKENGWLALVTGSHFRVIALADSNAQTLHVREN
jgi:hypothetical protein